MKQPPYQKICVSQIADSADISPNLLFTLQNQGCLVTGHWGEIIDEYFKVNAKARSGK